MRHLITSSLALILAACAATPAIVMQSGTTYTGALTMAPTHAAACLARNAETHRDWSASTHATSTSADVFVRALGTDKTLFVWRVHQASTGSLYTVHVGPHVIGHHQQLIAEMSGGC